MRNIYAIIGAGGCGRSIIPVLKDNLKNETDYEIIFVDDKFTGKNINGYKTFNEEKLKILTSSQIKPYIAVADPSIRSKIYDNFKNSNLVFENLFAKNSIKMDRVKIGMGCLISPFVTLTSNIKIGNFFHANLYSYVEHDCIIGDFVTFAPGVKCNGNVRIDDFAFIGSGAVIKNGNSNKKINIGKGAVVGAGAVVIEDVEPYSTVVGVPAKKMIT
jgi:sugar O-acyltransferase (sialic acid O-acetyltransferase NeuD family)